MSDGLRARRTFLQRAALGCAGLLTARLWIGAAATDQAPSLLLARRIARLVATPVPHAAAPSASLDLEALADLLGSREFATLLELPDTQLRQLISSRIQQQYQQGAVVRHHGWWLARGEVALLRLV